MAESKDPDFVEEVREMICYFTSERGLPEEDGLSLAAAVTNWIRENYKGERVSIKTRNFRYLHAEQIKAEFDGTNLAEIMKRYSVSRATVYRIAGE